MSTKLFLLAASGGAIGAGARYLVGVATLRVAGPAAAFPWATFTVNVVGSFAMGMLIELIAQRYSASQELRTFLATGVLGGFTTFSAFSLDVVTLMERKANGMAAVYVASSVALSILALFAGLHLARQFLS
ncbi:MAG: fluoride efflux transporter CrcB [Pseudomonadota bacterium]